MNNLEDLLERARAKKEAEDIQYLGNHRLKKTASSVTVHADGNLAKVTVGGKSPKPLERRTSIKTRGAVSGFSRGSRRRLMRMIASTDKRKNPHFATLTYPDIFDERPGTWKRDIDVFGKRFARKFPAGAFVWRIEFRPRKTGKSAGKIAPHFHLLVWNVAILDLRRFGDQAWFDTVASGSASHLAAGVNCQEIKTWKGIASYTSKYIAKEAEGGFGWKGRIWGVINRKGMPWSSVVTIQLADKEAVRATRMIRKRIGASGKVFRHGASFLVDGEAFLDYVEWLTAQD